MSDRYVQAPPYCIQVEPTEGCNLACTFCGIHGIRPHGTRAYATYRFLTVELAHTIAQLIAESGWTPRIEFAMHGEPTLNPALPDIVAVFRGWLPRHQLMLTTNGVALLQPGFGPRATELFEAGLTILALDNYASLKDIVARQARQYTRVPVYEYPQDRRGNPHRRVRPGERFVSILQDISLTSTGTHSQGQLGNHAGAAAPKDFSAMGRRCAKPFRELAIRWDGAVAICCNDWRGDWKVGRVQEAVSLERLWQSPPFQAARRRLYHGLRDRGPCHGCNHVSFRPGLLPDPRGRLTLPLPLPEDEAIITAALAGAPYTAAVRRPWEATP